MAKIKVLAVEDDALYADTLRMVIDQLGYELIGITDQPRELLHWLETTPPDVLLMDIDLGGAENGVQLVQRINESWDVPVIYVTTYRDKEMLGKAMATQPEGYVTKPYDGAQLQAAIELAIMHRQNELSAVASQQPAATPALDAIFIKVGNNLVKLPLADILLIEAFDKYTYVHTRDKKHLLSVALKNILPQLPANRFVQVHRSFIINLEAIEKINLQRNHLEINGRRVPVSRSYKAALYARLTTI